LILYLIGLNVPLPVAGKIDALAALHRQRRYAVHLIAIRDAPLSSRHELCCGGIFVICLRQNSPTRKSPSSM
jgi:hypothetical protein